MINEDEKKIFLNILSLFVEQGSVSTRDASIMEDLMSDMPAEVLCKKHSSFFGNLGEKITDLQKREVELTAEVSMLNQMKADILSENYSLRQDLAIYREVEATYSDNNYDKKLFSLLLKNMGFNQAVSNIFYANEMVNAGQLLSYTESDLLDFRQFGKKCLYNVREVLDKHNLKLRK